ncbi:hypothetical protein J6590_069686 [Homalodisca vitripennis]|nr:hypothetical protein J6590_069686 [Homalodisca vitripennis]
MAKIRAARPPSGSMFGTWISYFPGECATSKPQSIVNVRLWRYRLWCLSAPPYVRLRDHGRDIIRYAGWRRKRKMIRALLHRANCVAELECGPPGLNYNSALFLSETELESSATTN